jgi:hypothetical protein
LRINNSRISFFWDCEMKFNWAFRVGITPKRVAMPLFVGRVVHEGLAAYYKYEKDLEKAKEVMRTDLQREVDTMNLFPGEEGDYLEQTELCENLLGHYHDAFKKEDIEVIHPEVEFLVQLGDSPHEIMGRADGIAIWNGSLWTLEHKTAASFGKNSFKKFALDPQPSTYIYGASKALDIELKGVIPNILVKSKASRGVYRDYIPRTKTHINHWLLDTLKVVSDIERADESGHYAMNGNACTRFGICPYHMLCEALVNGDDVQSIQNAHYEKRHVDYVDTGETKTKGREKV